MSDTILTAENLKFRYDAEQPVYALDGVSVQVKRGEFVAVLGANGCGKSTLAKTGVGLNPFYTGEIKGMERHPQMIFQDPYASLNARMTVMDIVCEALDLHSELKSKDDKSKRVYELLDRVGLMKEHANRYPHEFSGGQRQRIGIARALAVDPEFIVCDEPISALDVSIQAQVLNLMQKLQKDMGLTYLFISHNLSVVKHLSLIHISEPTRP